MSSTFLDVLPREIRDQIYGYVLSSPTRLITLAANHNITEADDKPDAYADTYASFGTPPYKIRCQSNGELVRLSFLRTCRQIYHEAKIIFWERNSIDLNAIIPEVYNTNRTLRKLRTSMGQNATSVEFTINILRTAAYCRTKGQNLVPFEDQLMDLAKWPNLKKIRLHMNLGEEGWDNFNGYGHTGLAKLLYCRRKGANDYWTNVLRTNMEALKMAGGKCGYLSHIKKELEIDAGYPLPNGNGFPQRMLKMYSGHPMEAFQELNEAWFGNLTLNGKLCYQEGKEVEGMFVQQPEPRLPTLKHFFFFKHDIDRWVDGQCGSLSCANSWPAGEEGRQARRLAWEESGRADCSFDLMREIHWPWNQMSPPDFVP
jgi:hypothetical protein